MTAFDNELKKIPNKQTIFALLFDRQLNTYFFSEEVPLIATSLSS